MHECPCCGEACDCDGDDIWNDFLPEECDCCVGDGDDEEDEDDWDL